MKPWEKIQLQAVAAVYDGTHQTPTYTPSGVPFVSVENIGNLNQTEKSISAEDFKRDFKNKPRAGDILMTRITAGVIGATALIPDDRPLAYYVSLALIRSKGELLPSFLKHQIEAPSFKRELHQRTIHVAFPRKINLGDIGECSVYSTVPDEQRKIADFLTAVDQRIAQLRQKKALLEDYKKGVMQQLFTQALRFKDDHGKEFPDWEEKTLGEIGAITTGKTPSTSDEAAWIGDTMFVTPSDIGEDTKFQEQTSRHVNAGKLRLIPKNSLMFTCIASVGKMSIAAAPCITNQQINSVSVSTGFSFEFVYYALRYLTPQIKATQANTTLPIINKTEFSKFVLPIPSLAEQQRIANFLSALDRKIDSVANQITQTQAFKKGLLQQMFV